MKSKKAMLLCFIGLILFSIIALTGCRENSMTLQKAFNDFSQILEQAMLDGLRLKIYYLPPSIFTRAPLTVDNLIRSSSTQKIVIDSERLKEHIDLLNQLTADSLVPVKHKSHLAARLCYIFETDNDGTILEIAIGGINNSVFVNGIEVEYNDLFYDVIEPFLTEEARKETKQYFNGEYFTP